MRHLYPVLQHMKTLGYRFALLILLVATLARAVPTDESISVFKLGGRFFKDSLYNLALEQYRKYLTLPRPPEHDPSAYFNIATCEYKLGNMHEAAAGFDEYVRLFPGDDNIMDALFLAGKAFAAVDEHKQASERFYLVWSRFVGSARAQTALYESAVNAQQADNPERAIELYDLYLRRFPKDERSKQVSLSLAGLHTGRKDYAAAAEVLEKGRKQWPNDKQYVRRLLYRKALLARRMQRTEDAAESFSAMMDMKGVSFEELGSALDEYASFLMETRRYAEALDVFAELQAYRKKQGGRLSAQQLLDWAESARKAKRFERAEELYGTLLKYHADSINAPRARYFMAECRIGKGDFAGAIETLQNLALEDSLQEYGARAILKIGDLYFGKDLYVPAIAAYRRYLQLPSPRNADAILFRIGVIYQDKFSQYGSAAREFEELLKRYPTSAYAQRALFRVAQCLEELGDFQAALRNYRYLTEADGDEGGVGARARERIDYLETHRIKDAEGAVYELAELVENPRRDMPEYERLRRLALIYQRNLKDYDRAIHALESILKLEPSAPDSIQAAATYATAVCYERLAEKARMERSREMAAHAREQARTLYSAVNEKYPGSRYSDDAAFRLMMVEKPEINDYEQFINAYPKSRHVPEVLYGIAQHYEQAGGDGIRKAVDAYQTITARFPSNSHSPRALLGLGRCYLRLGQPDSTEQVVAELFRRFDQPEWKPEGLFLRGIVERGRGRYRDAIETFRNLLYQFPFSGFAGRARYELAEAQLAVGEIFEALSNFRVYAQSHPEGESVLAAKLGIGTCLARMGKTEEAQTLLTELMSSELDDAMEARAAYVLASIAENEGDIYRALELYKKVLGGGALDNEAQVYGHVANLYFENRIYDEAADAYGRALEAAGSSEDSTRYLKGRINAMVMGGKGRNADKLIARYKELYGDENEGFADIVYHEGLHLIHAKEYEKAANRFKYVLAKHAAGERADDAAYQLALAHFYEGDKEGAFNLFMGFTTKYPKSELVPYAAFKVAMIYHEREEYGRAAEHFASVVDHRAADAKTRFRAANNAALDYQKVLAWGDAARMYRRVLDEFPDEVPISTAHLKIGFCLVQASRFEEAI
ncbi:MAG: tetratricopeptide repeat protein, partial [Chitinivibrionales bacterium]|nr:tetratricopeptide repeat protein [Chitinivibrionales bacterium]